MYSVIHQGKVLDFHFKKMSNYCYNFSVGDIFIGQIFKLRKHSWSGISFHNVRGSMDGFGCRFYAAQYLLRLNGFAA